MKLLNTRKALVDLRHLVRIFSASHYIRYKKQHLLISSCKNLNFCTCTLSENFSLTVCRVKKKIIRLTSLVCELFVRGREWSLPLMHFAAIYSLFLRKASLTLKLHRSIDKKAFFFLKWVYCDFCYGRSFFQIL